MSFPNFGWQFFAYFLMWLTVVFLNKLTVFLTSLTAFLVSLTFSWKCWHLLRRSPNPWKTLRWFAKRLEAQSLQRVSASMPSAKLGIILQTLFIFLINLRFPHPSLLTSLLMGLSFVLYLQLTNLQNVSKSQNLKSQNSSSFWIQNLFKIN